jgi:DNA-directed RNA polymerase specialized sigma24 family protein
MTSLELTDDSAPAPMPLSIAVLAVLCQESYRSWASAASENDKQALRERNRSYVELLWIALADDLRIAARSWIRSQIAPDVESLAMNMFSHIIFTLPKLRIDPARNVQGLLLTVARRGIIDEYRRNYAAPVRRQPAGSALERAAGTRATQMWPGPSSHAPTVAPAEAHLEAVDPASYDAEDRVARALDNQDVLRAIWAYWPKSLSADDFQIMRLRWLSDPPRSFKEIAQLLGAGWSEDAVRQRHHRVLKDTRAHLREHGLLDEAA